MIYEEKTIETIPVGPLGLVPLKSCTELGKKVNDYLVTWRRERESEHKSTIAFAGYQRDSYIIDAKTPRFGSGEAKGTIESSVRGDDLYIMVDVCNYSLTYSMAGMTNHMSPDDHYQDLKRVIAAAAGKAHRINVIMPFLYEGRQHKRSGRESLDCALALQELVNMGVENIITFDAHDPRVQNAIPLKGFETVQPIYQFIKYLLKNETELQIDSDHMMVISPDEGGMGRAIYFANVLGLDMGMFYKRRDYTKIVNGRNPIVAHEFLGSSVEGKDVLIIDDMISSGESMLDVAKELKRRKARKVFVCATFGLFTNGLSMFDKYYEDGLIDRVLTTNLVYQTPDLLSRPYYISVDLSKYIALIIDNLNHDATLNYMSDELDKMEEYQKTFIANVSHDFRSPLTSIKGYLEAILDGTIPPEMQEKYLTRVISETDRLNKLTQGLLTLNSLDSKGYLSRSNFDINRVIKDTAASFEGTCDSKNIVLDLTFAENITMVYADLGKIQQVLYNLIDNAIKFSHPDSTIFIQTTLRFEKVYVSVKDTGIGIPKDSIKKIWERFYKTDLSRGKDKKGTGLGLSIVKEIIQNHGETIDVISTSGVGSEFIFSLPRAMNL
jgi:ribose-phosphate pyrophosphokinase